MFNYNAKDGSRNSTIKSNSSKMNIQSNIARESLSVPEVNYQSKTLDGIPLSQKKNLDNKNEMDYFSTTEMARTA